MKSLPKLILLFLFIFSCKEEEAVKPAAKSSEKGLLSFSFQKAVNPNIAADAAAMVVGTDVQVLLPPLSKANNLIANFTISPKASISVAGVPQESGVTANDFSKPISYKITAEDGSSALYSVNTAIAKSNDKSINAFAFTKMDNPDLAEDIKGVITGKEIAFTIPKSVKNANGLKASFQVSPLAKVFVSNVEQESGKTSNDFTKPITYKIVAEDESFTEYAIKAQLPKSDEKNIERFYFAAFSPVAEGVIDQTKRVINLEVPLDADLEKLIPTIVVSPKATVNPNSGISQNFLSQKSYIVTAEDGSSKEYAVFVSKPITIVLSYKLVGSVIEANNKSQMIFTAKAYNKQQQEIMLPDNIRLIDNGFLSPYSLNFPYKTNIAGVHKFQAAAPGNLFSQEVTLNIQAPKTFPLVKIPVIFHSFNIKYTKAEIDKIFTNTNNAFADKYFKFTANDERDPSGVNTFMEFVPYEFDADGQKLETPGLDLIPIGNKDLTATDYFKLTNANYWDPKTVLNIWIKEGKFLIGVNNDIEVAGIATSPKVSQDKAIPGIDTGVKGEDQKWYHGIHVSSLYINDVGVLAHEIGHIFGLSHVFNGGGNNAGECAKDVDYCPDTHEYDRVKYNQNINTLGYNRIRCDDGSKFLSLNIMDYQWSFTNSFTYDQRERLRHIYNYGLDLATPFNSKNGRRPAHNLKMPVNGATKYSDLIICKK